MRFLTPKVVTDTFVSRLAKIRKVVVTGKCWVGHFVRCFRNCYHLNRGVTTVGQGGHNPPGAS